MRRSSRCRELPNHAPPSQVSMLMACACRLKKAGDWCGSNTQPVLVMRFEATSKKLLANIRGKSRRSSKT